MNDTNMVGETAEMTAAELIRYLPAVYRRDYEDTVEGESGALKTILTLFAGVYSELERKVEGVHRYFDPLETPAQEFLDWLSGWVVLEPDEGWGEEKKRLLIREAAELYRHRGTPHGLKRMVKLFFEIPIDIEEWKWPRGMELGLNSTLGSGSVLYDRVDPGRCFKVTWRPGTRNIKPGIIKKIRALLDLEKPAHTECYFHVRLPSPEVSGPAAMVVGVTSVLGRTYLEGE